MAEVLSVCFGTLNRAAYLRQAITSVRKFYAGAQFYITDGGSDDGTLEYLREQKDVTLIEHGKRLGARRAFNDAFRAARGEYVFSFNDDAEIRDDCLNAAIQVLASNPGIGQVAIPFRTPHFPQKVDFCPINGVHWTYANFGVISRELGEQLGWWGDYLYHYGGDSHLSMMVWKEGLRVAPIHKYCILHYETKDATRVPNEDSPKFYQYWSGFNGHKSTI